MDELPDFSSRGLVVRSQWSRLYAGLACLFRDLLTYEIPFEHCAPNRYADDVARVAQLDRVSASEAEGCGFDPRRAHHLCTWVGLWPVSCSFL